MSRSSLLLALFLLALCPRLWNLARTAAAPASGDAIEYESLGHALATGQGYRSEGGNPLIVAQPPQPTAFRTPGLPLFIAAHYALLRQRLLWAPRLSLIVLNAAAAVVLTLALRGGRSGPIPWLAGLLYAVWPESLRSFYQNDLLLAESLALPLLCFFLWCYSDGRRWAVLLAGVLLGALILVRAYLFLVPAAMIVVGALWRRRDLMQRAALVGLLALLVVIPWSARNYRVFGRLVPLSTQQGVSLWCGWQEGARGSWSAYWYKEAPLRRVLAQQPDLAQLSEPQRSAVFAAAAQQAIRERGAGGNVLLLLRKWALFASPYDVGGWHVSLLLILPLALYGGVRALLRPLDERGRAARARQQPTTGPTAALDQVLVALAATALLVVGVIFMDQRFRYIALPATLTFAADGAAAAGAALRRRRARQHPLIPSSLGAPDAV